MLPHSDLLNTWYFMCAWAPCSKTISNVGPIGTRLHYIFSIQCQSFDFLPIFRSEIMILIKKKCLCPRRLEHNWMFCISMTRFLCLHWTTNTAIPLNSRFWRNIRIICLFLKSETKILLHISVRRERTSQANKFWLSRTLYLYTF